LEQLRRLTASILSSARDLLPIVLVVAFFQLVVIQQPFPNLDRILLGCLLVMMGLAFWLLTFAFALGFGTTIAEPALTAIADEAARVAAEGGAIAAGDDAMQSYALGLRLTVAVSVGFAIVAGVYRIIRGWPIQYLIIGGYIGVIIMTAFAPPEIIGIAYDSGGVTTSTVTVPLVTALGVGLATSIKGRNPMIDGFGLIAFASLTPMIFVMAYGIVV
jgi:hypothetical protein